MSERRCIPALSHQYSQWVHRSPRSRVTRNSRQAYIIPCHGYGLFISTDLISNLQKKQAATLTVACVRIAAGPNCEWNQWRSKALRGPGSTVTWGALSCFGPKGWSWKPKVLSAGVGLWLRPGTGPGERCKLPQWGLPAAKGFGAFCVLRWPLLVLKSMSFHRFLSRV